MNIINPNDVLVIERGDTVAPIALQLSDTNAAMARLHEIRNTNAATFPELISVLIQASNELFQAIATVRQELIKNEHKVGQLRARLLIEEVPTIVAARQLKNTVDVCNAIMDLDPDYSRLTYTQELLNGAMLLLENKLTTLKSAQFAIRDIARLSFDGRFNHPLPQQPISNGRNRQPDVYDLGDYDNGK